MKILKLAVLSAATLLCMESCKKENTQIPSQLKSTDSQIADKTNWKPVKQKEYELTLEQIIGVIKKFKHEKATQNYAMQSRMVEADSIAIDSSVYVIEAALNFDFDRANIDNNNEIYTSSYETAEFEIPCSADGKVNSDQLEDVYNNFTNTINSFIDGDYKIHMIDIEASQSIDDMIVSYQAKVSVLNTSVKSNCAPWPSSIQPYASAGWGPMANIGVPGFSNLPDATVLLENKLQCMAYAGCTNGYFFTGIISVGFISNPNFNQAPNALLTTPYYPFSTWNSVAGVGYVSRTGLNNFRSGLQSLIANNVQAPYSLASTDIVSHLTTNTAVNPNTYSICWNFIIYKGKRHCYGNPPN